MKYSYALHGESTASMKLCVLETGQNTETIKCQLHENKGSTVCKSELYSITTSCSGSVTFQTTQEHICIYDTFTSVSERVKHRLSAIYSYVPGCQIGCNWSRLKPVFKVPAHQSTISQINMIPNPVTLN